ncbi:MAG TPA: extensin family protein [Polyangiaceae bacterium]|nr:extensin family protein [Polyangiaceae bacterium]
MPKQIGWLKIAAFSAMLSGCAHEAGQPQSPAPGWAAGWVLPASEYEFPPKTLPRKTGSEPGHGAAPKPVVPVVPSPLRFAAAPGVPTYADGRPRPLAPELIAEEFPGGDQCLSQLHAMGVPFNVVSDKRGVETPIALEGPIGGVRYWTVGAGPMVSDCRLALALAKVAPELRGLGITAMRFSGAYSYRMAKVGRLSLHAYGLAIDVHEITAYGQSFVVAHDFARGLPNGCVDSAPVLNRLACRLSQLRLFQELLTPDSNADHRDHLHIAIAREPVEKHQALSASRDKSE